MLNNNTSHNVRVRFAPSPTGHLHIGGLRSAIFNWLFAKNNSGKFLMRIEDTDLERSKEEYTQSILQAFKWMEIESDEPIFKQSDRIKEYAELANKLLLEGKAYRCFCQKKIYSDSEDSSYSKYDSTCRYLGVDEIQGYLSNGTPYAIRFKWPKEEKEFHFCDEIYGDITYPVDQFEDFIILRSNGQPMYNFVVVADDIFQRITHVIRGQEHLVNTPKQIMLYRALNSQVPVFAHLPLILGPSGSKLSKREAATSVISYKEEGYLPDALFNYLVRLGWSYGDKEIISKEEAINVFALSGINKSGAIFDIKKLEWVNSVYIKNFSALEILNYINKNINPSFQANVKLIELYKDRVKTLKELIKDVGEVQNGPLCYDITELAAYNKAEVVDRLKILEVALIDLISWDEAEISLVVKNLCKELNLKLPDLAKPIRVALTGKGSAPGVFELLYILSKETSIERISKFYEYLSAA